MREGKKRTQTGVNNAKVDSSSAGKKMDRYMSYAAKPKMVKKGPYAPT